MTLINAHWVRHSTKLTWNIQKRMHLFRTNLSVQQTNSDWGSPRNLLLGERQKTTTQIQPKRGKKLPPTLHWCLSESFCFLSTLRRSRNKQLLPFLARLLHKRNNNCLPSLTMAVALVQVKALCWKKNYWIENKNHPPIRKKHVQQPTQQPTGSAIVYR